jgi:ATP-dependent DNA ligase
VPAGSFVLDGELAIPVDGKLSFDELRLRLHPAASRVQKLANSHPAIFIVFDLLAEDRQRYLKRPLRERRILLEEFVRENLGSIKKIRLSPPTSDLAVATKWFDKVGGDLDGLVAKQIDAAYASGERTAAVKIKQIRTADCVVGGFRYASGEKILGSLLLGLYGDDGLLHHVGFTSAFKASERRALTRKFQALRKPPGFSGSASGRSESLEHRAQRRMGTCRPKNCCRSCLRSFHWQPVSARSEDVTLAFGQDATPMHDGSSRRS